MKGYSTLMITAAMFAASGIAAAQAETGADRVRLQGFATCVVQNDRVKAETLMKEVPGSLREDGAAKRVLTVKTCGDVGKPALAQVRPAIAEALYESDFGADGNWKGMPLAALYSFDKAVKVGMVEPGVKPGLGLIDIAQCVAKTDRAGTLSLFTTVPGSAEETSAFEPLEPHFSSCTPAGVSTAIRPAAMRGALAEALYRMAADKAGAPKAGAAK